MATLDVRDLKYVEGIEEIEKLFITKRVSMDDVTEWFKKKDYDVSPTSWYHHVRFNLKPQVALQVSKSVPDIANDVIDKYKECLEGLSRLRKVINRALDAPDLDPNILRVYVAAEKESRAYLETMHKLGQEFKESSNIHIENLNVEYSNVVNQVLQDACPKCKVKFAQTLEPLVKKKDG